MAVSAATEEIISHTPIEEMKERTRALYEEHREQVKAALPAAGDSRRS